MKILINNYKTSSLSNLLTQLTAGLTKSNSAQQNVK